MQKKTYTVCVFCGSKSGNNIKYLKLANTLGKKLAERNFNESYFCFNSFNSFFELIKSIFKPSILPFSKIFCFFNNLLVMSPFATSSSKNRFNSLFGEYFNSVSYTHLTLPTKA